VQLDPPEGEELPADGFLADDSGFQQPPEDGSSVEVLVKPDSERLQLLVPFAAWDGKDLAELPILVKALGKCTTDHISPAGAWLRYRGHLDRISDNMFIGAVNAFTNETGTGLNVLTGERAAFPQIARQYKEKGIGWVVIGDQNYGEGSSREHAAMSPRYLGCRAVIVRSFARIHETNLKKQGILPLTFSDPADYDKIRETDRISIVGLDKLKAGQSVKAFIHHEDGQEEPIELKHTMTDEEIDWFKAGSALNVIKSRREGS
jgi:aconitate hydratase